MERTQTQLTENPVWLKRLGGKKFLATAFVDSLLLLYSIWTFLAQSESMWQFLEFVWIPVLIFNGAYAGLEITDKFLQMKK